MSDSTDCNDDDGNKRRITCGVCGGSYKSYYGDMDGDGIGGNQQVSACNLASGLAESSGDCNDEDAGKQTMYCGVCGGVQRDCADFDKDGDIDFNDFFSFSDHFGAKKSNPKSNYEEIYDIDRDGDIDFDDFFQLADYFGK